MGTGAIGLSSCLNGCALFRWRLPETAAHKCLWGSRCGWVVLPGHQVISFEGPPKLVGLNAHNGIGGLVEVLAPAEHLGGHGIALYFVGPSGQRGFHNERKKGFLDIGGLELGAGQNAVGAAAEIDSASGTACGSNAVVLDGDFSLVVICSQPWSGGLIINFIIHYNELPYIAYPKLVHKPFSLFYRKLTNIHRKRCGRSITLQGG
jgi:hypothetical protein